jgi:serine/threonine protein kinase
MGKTKIGTPNIMAPEMISNQKYNQKSDIWSLGCVIYKMMTFKYPYEA